MGCDSAICGMVSLLRSRGSDARRFESRGDDSRRRRDTVSDIGLRCWTICPRPTKHAVISMKRGKRIVVRQRVQSAALADEPGFSLSAARSSETVAFDAPVIKTPASDAAFPFECAQKGAGSFAEYAGVLDTDPIEYDRLVDTLTINVSKFFRNPETFACIATKVMPELWSSKSPLIRIWSAGCATGEEPLHTGSSLPRTCTCE